MIVPGIKILSNSNTGSGVVMSHIVMSLLPFMGNTTTLLQGYKDAGIDTIWAHLDDYNDPDNFYNNALINLMNAASPLGIKVMPGWSMYANSKVQSIITDSWDHSALFIVDGQKIYAGWDYFPESPGFSQSAFDTYMTSQGKTTYKMWVSPRFPLTYDNITFYEESSSWPRETTSVEHFFNNNPKVGGVINFAVHNVNPSIPQQNSYIIQAANNKGRYAIAGTSFNYNSAEYFQEGFTGLATQWQSVLSLPVNQRPKAVSGTTGNDLVELSYDLPFASVTNGLAYIKPNGGFLGNNVRVPMLDHSGASKFALPFANAYKTGLSNAVFSTDKIFCSYYLHPVDASLIPTIPTGVAAIGAEFTQAWWNNTVFAKGDQNVPSIKSALTTQIGKIYMAAHLTAPSYLRIVINGQTYTSTLQQAGVAYFECSQALGTPVFSIISADGTTVRKTGAGPQAITNSCYPGGWNPLITEI